MIPYKAETKMQELALLKERLAAFFNSDDFAIEPLKNGASVRRYYIINFNSKIYFPRRQVILMLIPADRLAMADDYLNISYYFRRRKIPRPRLYEIHREYGWIFLAPAAGEQLDQYLREHPEEKKHIYPGIINFLIEVQKRAEYEKHCPAFLRFFDADQYLYEFDFHVRNQLLKHFYRHKLSFSENDIFNECVAEISNVLDSRLPVFVHRDFQSSNIFFNKNSSGLPFQIIDFQDARSGSLTYDLVSVLWDSYVEIPSDLREELVEKFFADQPLVQKHFSLQDYQKAVDYTIIQRKLHDAGAFVYTSQLLQNDAYLPYIDGAVSMALETMDRYESFKKAGEFLRKIRGE
ncbi:MAG: aminoglycoside phosphotransferase family protein [Calditrichia bacterium]